MLVYISLLLMHTFIVIHELLHVFLLLFCLLLLSNSMFCYYCSNIYVIHSISVEITYISASTS